MFGTDDAGGVSALAGAIGAEPRFPPAFGLWGGGAGDGLRGVGWDPGLGSPGSHLVQGWMLLQCGWRGCAAEGGLERLLRPRHSLIKLPLSWAQPEPLAPRAVTQR